MKHDMISRRQAVLERLDGYVRTRLLGVLGLAGSDFELKIPSEGTRSVVLVLRVGPRRFILKCFNSWPRAVRTVLAARHLISRGASVPRLVHTDLSLRTYLKTGLVVVVEQAISGQSLYELERNDQQLLASARALAGLHSITRLRWGSLLPGLGRRGDHFDFLQARLARRLEDLVSQSPEYGEAIAKPEFQSWFAAQQGAAAASRLRGYSLCHLRVTDTNVLLTADGQAVLIDLVTARYGHHAVDLERALYRWCEHVARREELFLEEYFRHFRVSTREQWEQARAYYRASFHLTQAYRAAKELRKFSEVEGRHFKKINRRRRNLARHLKLLLKVLEAAPDGPNIDLINAAKEQVRRAARPGREMPEQRAQGVAEPERPEAQSMPRQMPRTRST